MMQYPVLTSLLLNMLAMTGLSLAMPKHHQQLLNNGLPLLRIWLLRMLSITLIFMALWMICISWGIAAGIVLWLGLLSLAAIYNLCVLNHQPLRVISFMALCVLISVLLIV